MRPSQLLPALPVALLLALAVPTFAGGPLEAPDGTGPSATDFTGWTPVAFVYGVSVSGTHHSWVSCVNMGTVDTDLVVQWYDDASNPTRQPVEEDVVGLLPSDLDYVAITSGLSRGFARVLVSEKKAQVHCVGRIEDSTGVLVIPLEVVYLKKMPKVRIAKK